jgi:hypothetical protein
MEFTDEEIQETIAKLVSDSDFEDETPPQSNASSLYHQIATPVYPVGSSYRPLYLDMFTDNLMCQTLSQKIVKNNFNYHSGSQLERIHLPDYWLYCRGWSEETKEYKIERLRILQCESRLFHGAHFIQIDKKKPIWVSSLTALRKEILQFKDSVSFERSTFLTRPDLQVVRLKYIRHLIDVPILNPPEKIEKDLSERAQLQIMKHIHNMHEIYSRDTGVELDNEILYELINEYYNH